MLSCAGLLAARALCVSARPLPLSLRVSARASLLECRGTAAACRGNLQTTTKTEAVVCSQINGKHEISRFYFYGRETFSVFTSCAHAQCNRVHLGFLIVDLLADESGTRAGRIEAFPNRGRVTGFTGRACGKPRNKTVLCFCGGGGFRC